MRPLKGALALRVRMGVCFAVLCLGVFGAFQTTAFAQSPAPKELASLTLQAEASTLVRQDTVNLVMAKIVEGADPQALHVQLTSAMEPAFKLAKGHQALSVRSGGFRVSPVHGADGKISGWRGRSELVIESRDFQAATRLVSELADRLVLSSLRFHLSEEQRKKHESALIQQAAQAFRDRASLALQAFGYREYEIVKLDLSASVSPGSLQPVMLRSAASSSMPQSDVVLEADNVPVSVQVSGTVVLR